MSYEFPSSGDKILWIGIFGLTMGFFEAAVVEYLRFHFYPDGFKFPLKTIPLNILWIELGRELASILMLLSAGWLAGRNFADRFAGFMYAFGVWDITYYGWLKVFENWPPSLTTWDLLFLIPLPWIGPVWAPVGVSIGLIWVAVVYWIDLDRGFEIKLNRWEWVGEILSGLLIILSFMWNSPSVSAESPTFYPWYLWLIGTISGVVLFLHAKKRAYYTLERT